MHTHLHEIIHANTQAHNLAKVFNLPKIKHLTKVLIGSTKSEVLHFASPHFVLSMSSTRASNSQKPSYSNVSTINSWYFQAIPSKFSCATFQKNLQNTSHFVTLFFAHGDVVVGFAIFHIVLFQKEKRKKKKALLHGM
jgi:hypothetical protein